jgi:RNA polymerase sigma-70 factor (ECF subfamily)
VPARFDYSYRVTRVKQQQLYETAIQEHGSALDRVAYGYEADADKRRDLKQEMHLQLWKSLEGFDERCSLKTWTFRIAHNVAVSYVNRERRKSATFVTLEDIEQTAPSSDAISNLDEKRALERLSRMILTLKPLDRQIMLSYLEEMDAASIADITGLSPANVAMKIHRIKNILARDFHQERQHA